MIKDVLICTRDAVVSLITNDKTEIVRSEFAQSPRSRFSERLHTCNHDFVQRTRRVLARFTTYSDSFAPLMKGKIGLIYKLVAMHNYKNPAQKRVVLLHMRKQNSLASPGRQCDHLAAHSGTVAIPANL